MPDLDQIKQGEQGVREWRLLGRPSDPGRANVRYDEFVPELEGK
jgi:hypothetical protein